MGNETPDKRCNVCVSEYYLNNNRKSCVKGDVSHCKLHPENTANLCDSCETNFMKVDAGNLYDVCVPMTQVSICGTSISYTG